jgi:hypothetical protein
MSHISIEASADKSAVHADISVSLGLIVTELVINALKHAFPAGRHGRIMVDYQAHGSNWTLSVGDNGVGMPEDPASATPGLDTSIVEALARQLHARVKVADAKPGLIDQGSDVILLADVGVDELGFRAESAQLLNERLAGLITPTGNDDLGALLGEGDGSGAPDAGQGASDQHDWAAHLRPSQIAALPIKYGNESSIRRGT